MKLTLTFDLPEETEEAYVAQYGHEYLTCLRNLREFLRQRMKHSDEESISHDDLYDRFYEICEDVSNDF